MATDGRKVSLVVVTFLVIWFALDQTARLLGSFRGEAGVAVALLVVSLAIAAEVLVFRTRLADAPRLLGLKAPSGVGTAWALALSAALIGLLPFNAWLTGIPIALTDGWVWLALGILAQAGIAEEVLFRGFLFRHFREGRSFWRAALLSAIPFVAVHLLIFLTVDFAIALASVLVSVSLAFPFAWLFERSNGSIWPPAILHAVVQGGIKLVVVPADSFATLAIVWMIASALAPWLVFVMRPAKPDTGPGL